MKKTSAVLLLLATVLTTTVKSQVYLGPHLGLNYSTFTSDYGTYKRTTGFNGGLCVKIGLADHFALRLEPAFSMTGGNNQTKDSVEIVTGNFKSKTTTKNDYRTTLNYIQMPIMIQYGTRIAGAVVEPYDDIDPYIDIHLFAGPYVGYFIGGKENGSIRSTLRETDGDNGTDTIHPVVITPVKRDVKDGISGIDMGITAGVGFTFNLGYSNQIILSFAWSRGLMSINDKFDAVTDKITGKPVFYNMFNNNLQFGLSYVVSLGRK